MVKYIIVQAGGKGTRMGYVTANRPKCLVPIDNLPMIFHLFKKYPDKKYIIIGDYKYDVLKKYLKTFATVDYKLVNSSGKEGTISGINQALKHIPNNECFMLVWSDLILNEDLEIPEKGNFVGISGDFKCRWRYKDNEFIEVPSYKHGVAGLFIFDTKNELRDLPSQGEFVKWIKNKEIKFKKIPLNGSREYGLLGVYEEIEKPKCRPFNNIKFDENHVIKRSITSQGALLAKNEIDWYKYVKNKGYSNIPFIYSYNPLTLQRINGPKLYEYNGLDKSQLIKNVVEVLEKLHRLSHEPSNTKDVFETYFEKTFQRLNKVRELIPYSDKEIICINGRMCRNVFFYQDWLKSKVASIKVNEFSLIHGDSTFSNILINMEKDVFLIDPRGYFGQTKFYGDSNYDWAKLYYSLIGNYDQFNLKRFRLNFSEDNVSLKVQSSGYEHLEDEYFALLPKDVDKQTIKLLHSIIWLSLTTYAWEDYDSLCGAFYMGLYYMEEVL